jgi:hypothetical protein
MIEVEARDGRLSIDSPVPVVVDLPGQAELRLPAGGHDIAMR